MGDGYDSAALARDIIAHGEFTLGPLSAKKWDRGTAWPHEAQLARDYLSDLERIRELAAERDAQAKKIRHYESTLCVEGSRFAHPDGVETRVVCPEKLGELFAERARLRAALGLEPA